MESGSVTRSSKGAKDALVATIALVCVTVILCMLFYLVLSVEAQDTYYEGRFESLTVSAGGFGHDDIYTIVLDNQTLVLSKYNTVILSLEPGGYYNFTIHEGMLSSYVKIDK